MAVQSIAARSVASVMGASVTRPRTDPHALLLGIDRSGAAKNLGIADWNRALGRALARAIAIVGWSQKEAAARIGVCEADLSKWLSGERRAHLDRILAVEELRRPFLLAVVGLTERVDVVVTIPLSPAVNA